MNTVIRCTKTIAEFKKVKAEMEERALKSAEEHKSSCENWKEGQIVKIWYENYQNREIICIEYESGSWWHYRVSNNTLEWW